MEPCGTNRAAFRRWLTPLTQFAVPPVPAPGRPRSPRNADRHRQRAHWRRFHRPITEVKRSAGPPVTIASRRVNLRAEWPAAEPSSQSFWVCRRSVPDPEGDSSGRDSADEYERRETLRIAASTEGKKASTGSSRSPCKARRSAAFREGGLSKSPGLSNQRPVREFQLRPGHPPLDREYGICSTDCS